mmetsp:Transcript_112995/g.319635  ORF Transcript_112995/g.319635 Transcript_112995/m.319635 type:complete len:376 (-) Transcript_112995:186-1313(-)
MLRSFPAFIGAARSVIAVPLAAPCGAVAVGRGSVPATALGGRKRQFGTYFQDLSTVRQRLVLKNQILCRRIGLALGNAGYLVGLLEYGVTDMVLLRMFAMTGAAFIVGWQLFQPKVQWVTASWCLVYSSVNVYQLARLQTEPVPELSWEESRLLALLTASVPEGKGFSKKQFHALMQFGEWLWLIDGAKLAEQGCGNDGRYLYFVTVGTCEVSRDGCALVPIGPGSVVGDTGLLCEDEDASFFTVTACGSVRCFVIPIAKVRKLLELEPDMRGALDGVFADRLTSTLASLNHGAKLRNYRAVLEVACLLDQQQGVAVRVSEYRERHGIGDDVHSAFMEELPQCMRRSFMSARQGADNGGQDAPPGAPPSPTLQRD